MRRILINATHNEEIRVALCKGNHMYDFDLENRTREQKKSNIYKAHVTRVEPSLEAVFVEYGAERQGFLPIREIAKEYLSGNPRTENIRDLIKEGDTLIVQVEKEERGNKGAALSTFISLAGRYLVLMPNNPRGGGISRQISGKQREEMKRIVSNLQMPKGMSVIIRTAGIGKTQDDLQHDLDHLLHIWEAIGEQDRNHPSPRLMHQEAGVVTRALRDYMRDDIAEIWIDNANAYDEAAYFIKSVMPKQIDKLRKYTDPEPMFARFGIEKQIETAYQREVRLPSGGSIVIDQTEAMVAIDINSAKSTKGSDVAETAYHTNLEAAEEIARQLRLRDMGGLVVIDFIDMYDSKHQKDVEKRLVDSTKQDRARVQFGEISKFGLMEMSRQRLRPSLEESTGYKCPRCHGTGMIRDLRSLGLSIMRQIEQVALSHRQGELQVEVPTELAAFLLNEKRDSLVYLEQDSGTRITILPHAHMESPDYEFHFNPEGFAPSSYERISDSEDQQTSSRGYEVNWQTADNKRPEHQPTRQPKKNTGKNESRNDGRNNSRNEHKANKDNGNLRSSTNNRQQNQNRQNSQQVANQTQVTQEQPQAVAWLSNLFAPTPQAQTAQIISSQEAAQAIESIVNNGGQSLGSFGQVDMSVLTPQSTESYNDEESENEGHEKRRKPRHEKGRDKKDRRHNKKFNKKSDTRNERSEQDGKSDKSSDKPRREPNSRRESRGEYPRGETLVLEETVVTEKVSEERSKSTDELREQPRERSNRHDNRKGRDKNRRNRNEQANEGKSNNERSSHKQQGKVQKSNNPDEVNLHVARAEIKQEEAEVVHLSLDQSKPVTKPSQVKVEDKKKEVSVEQLTDKSTEKPAKQAVEDSEKTSAQTKEVSKESEALSSMAVEQPQPSLRKDGRANNDPRVVRAELAKQIAEKLGVKKPITEAEKIESSDANPVQAVSSKIVGNVGEFLRTTLENAEERIEKEGVIACFIEAVEKYKQGSDSNFVSVEKEQTANSAIEESLAVSSEFDAQIDSELAKFDFSNYGYETLTTEYLSEFSAMTTAVGQFDILQGKTEIAPNPIGKRANNDPRGQHPDFVEEMLETESEAVGDDVVVEAQETLPVSIDETPLSEEVVTEAVTILDVTSKVQDVTTTDSESSSDTIEPTKPDAFADAFGRMLDETETETVVEVEKEVEPVDVQVEEQSSKEESSLDDAKDTVLESAETDEPEERTKTTFDKYKSMLANVSEQLSGQTGGNSLFLSTPTIPKTRSRKKDSE